MIRITDLHHRLGGAPVLNDIDLTIPHGGLTALIGPNGAGKSTLLSLIARLRPIQRGRISVGPHEIGKVADRDLARVLAVMPQSTEVSARLRLAELVGFGRYPWHRGRPGAEDRAQVDRALERFSLTDLRDRFLDEVSGGQKQRAFAAMAYAQDTDYLLLDEPLNNLDIAAARDLMRLMRGLADEDGKTVVVVLHDINYATAFADRLVVMKEGRIAAQGAPSEVVTDTLLAEVFGTTARVAEVEGRPLVIV
ncbi:ABC transporter ATP-binding protein [Oceanicola sp. 22II-s10i]|uniref:iron ABC transporter ATP-binding protein n=1 Tax=Oceanicola sp. 22II-s10i TaxID=1317116 RepID=UPI000B520DE3|nr:ATP-binding cassette domain-containing protein [Oceanicola sp. 22II-s10i]OWU82991.1 ABC transporter ATP-binding protein [Oceanicola sp. 22II-s10i]